MKIVKFADCVLKSTAVVALLVSPLAHGQDATAESEAAADSASTDANNPLANFTAFNIQNYYIPELTGTNDTTANTAWLRYAQPFGKWLFRGSLPFAKVPISSTTSESGLGDLNGFMARIIDVDKPGVTFGVGPQVTLDTATEDATGTGHTQAGFAAVYFNGSSPVIQWGGLLTWQTDISGDSSRPGTNLTALQPFYFVQLGNGLYFRGAPIWVFNNENDTYHIPVGAGIGKVLNTESVVYNIFFEPQFTILSKGSGQPELQLFAGFNMQFK